MRRRNTAPTGRLWTATFLPVGDRVEEQQWVRFGNLPGHTVKEKGRGSRPYSWGMAGKEEDDLNR